MKASDLTENKFGRLVRTVKDEWAFVPNPLPPAIDLSPLATRLSAADRAIGRLDGIGSNLENPHLLIGSFLRREAVLSSRIEGTQADLEDLLLFEVEPRQAEPEVPDVREVRNYVRAMEYGLDRGKALSVSLRLIRELHQKLMAGVRGKEHTPGEFRQEQNWIGLAGCPIEDATFVPPPPEEMKEALDALEKFVNSPGSLPPLIRLAMIHYQFEAIHPFRDGNGRIGRLLIALMMCLEGTLSQPLLNLSAFFERHRSDYYRHLLEVSTAGRWVDWIGFFLRGVTEQAKDGCDRANRLLALRKEFSEKLRKARSSALLLQLLDQLFVSPTITAPRAAKLLNVTPASAYGIIDKLVKGKILREVTGKKRNRVFVADGIVRVIEGEGK